MRHATALRVAEINVMNALRDYLTDPQPVPASDGGQPESHAEEPPAPDNSAQEYQPY